MVGEEYGLAPTSRSPWRAALSTFAAFGLAGAVPLLPYVFQFPDPFKWAALLTAITFTAIGDAKGRAVASGGWRSALETLAIGSAASALAFVAGALLQQLV